MYNGQIQCNFGCLCDENQQHIFEECKPLREGLHLKEGIKLNDVYGDIQMQKAALSNFIQIEEKRVDLKKKNWKKHLVHIYINSFIATKFVL